MAIDFTSISPADLVRLLNSTRLGHAITERQLYRHRMEGGLRIGGRDSIHLLRYAQWLAAKLLQHEAQKARMPTDKQFQYEQHKRRAARRQADIAEAGQEIGQVPDVINPARRAACERDFKRFCETYFAEYFYMAWSEDHLRAIKKIEAAVLEGKLFAFAMPRGSGKSVLCLAAVQWAALYGHSKFICLIAATERMAKKLLEKVYNSLERRQILFDDFPEVCFPIRKLERTPQRAQKQKCGGAYTYMLWTKREIVLPTIKLLQKEASGSSALPCVAGFAEQGGLQATGAATTTAPDSRPQAPGTTKTTATAKTTAKTKKTMEKPSESGLPESGMSVYSPASGTIISVCGLTGGEVRGQNKDMPDGSIMRPSLVLLDDPQTKGSAKSPTQCQDRIELLQGDVLGMAGPDRSIAGMMPCTIIRPGDMADQILDIEKNPEWHGERTKMVYSWPEAEGLWEEYANIRAAGLRRGDGGAAGNEFYRAHRAAMDAGSKVAWPERFTSDCISAIQHAMNLKLRDEVAFFAEYQNEPLVAQDEDDLLNCDQIAEKLNRRAESSVPTSATLLAMFIDVQKKLLYYTIYAFEPNFTSYLVEYGAWPDQKLQYFAYRQARRTLLTSHRGGGEEAAIFAGLEELTAEKLPRTYTRDDGAAMHISRCMIDSGYQKDTVELFCRQSKFAAIVTPSKGLPVTASSTPLDERKRKKGEELGDNWRLSGRQGEHSVRLMLYDTNYWKSFLQARIAVPMGGKGCLSLWGKSPQRHKMISEHLASEFRVRTEGRGRKVDEWKLPAHAPDNHLLDCSVGCMVAASYEGCRLLDSVVPKKAAAKRRSLGDMARTA